MDNNKDLIDTLLEEERNSKIEHRAIKNRIYIALVGIIVIITNLIALYLKK